MTRRDRHSGRRGDTPAPHRPRDELDALLRDWHAVNAERARQGRDRLLSALPAPPVTRERHRRPPRETLLVVVGRRLLNPYTRAAASLAVVVALLALLVTLPSPPARAALPGSSGGRLEVVDESGDPVGSCLLARTDARIDVSGRFARGTVRQRFVNPYDHAVDAAYTFSAGPATLVDDLAVTIGERVIVAEVHSRERGGGIHDAARHRRALSALVDASVPDGVVLSVTGIDAGATVDVAVGYVQVLPVTNGWHRLVFPMAVSPWPRPGTGTPVTRSGRDIAVTVTIDAGGSPIVECVSETHAIRAVDGPPAADGDGPRRTVTLRNRPWISNRDFMLQWRVPDGEGRDARFVHWDPDGVFGEEAGGFFTLVMAPPAPAGAPPPRELVFVADATVAGDPEMRSRAAATLLACLESLPPGDLFNVVAVGDGVDSLWEVPRSNTTAHRDKAHRFLTKMPVGTRPPLAEAWSTVFAGVPLTPASLADLPADGRGVVVDVAGVIIEPASRAVVLLNGGEADDRERMLDAIRRERGDTRVYGLGIGPSPDRSLLDRLAVAGGGWSATATRDVDTIAAGLAAHLPPPTLTDPTLSFDGGLEVFDVVPSVDALPDLLGDQPLIVHGRYAKPGSGAATLAGQTPAGRLVRSMPLALPAPGPRHDVLPRLWVQAKAAALHAAGDTRALRAFAERFGIVTPWTSLVAVEHVRLEIEGETSLIRVPVETPARAKHAFGESPPRPVLGAQLQLERERPDEVSVPAEGSGADAGEVADGPQTLDETGASMVDRLKQDAFGDRAGAAESGRKVAVEPLTRAGGGDAIRDRVAPSAATPPGPDRARHIIGRGLSSAAEVGQAGRDARAEEPGPVLVSVLVTDVEPGTLDTLRAAGLSILDHGRVVPVVVGLVPTGRLPDLAALDRVRRIEATVRRPEVMAAR